LIRVKADDLEVEVTFRERRWVFPRCDCILLPVPNTTTELLARHIGHKLLAALQARTGARPTLLRIEVDECEGQAAMCEIRPD
jgi:6-pyruvoyltetrahydropterin/6-carboxytetrahydropterin synthase